MKEFAETLVREAGETLLQHFHKAQEVSYDQSGVFAEYPQAVSKVEIEIENKMINQISQTFPEHNILAECASNIDKGAEYTWIIDSLDGTTQYIRRLPYFSVSAALSYQGKVILGTVYNPLLGELYSAEKGKGASLNGRPIRVSETQELLTAVLGSSVYHSYRIAKQEHIFLKIMSSTKNVRIHGSPAMDLCYVAEGKLDGRVICNAMPYDFSAGCIMIEEAGGKVTDWNGNHWSIESKTLLATNNKLHKMILKILEG